MVSPPIPVGRCGLARNRGMREARRPGSGDDRMAWLGFVIRWWLIVSLASVLGISLIVAWEWFVTTRLPFARWRVRMSRHPTSRTLFIREAMRVRRIRVEPGQSSGPKRE